MESNTDTNRTFSQKIWTAAGIAALVVVLLLILKAIFSVILLIIAGLLIAVYFRGFALWLEEKAHLSSNLSLAIVIVGTLVLVASIPLLLGSQVQSQFLQLSKQLPQSTQEVKEKISQYSWGEEVVNNSKNWQKKLDTKRILSSVRSFFKTTFGVLGDIYVILFIAIFFTADPVLYRDRIVSLIPPAHKKDGEQILNRIGFTLRDWLLGKIFAMIVVAVLTGIGLLVLGVPMPLALALIAGALNFIPNFGPLLAMIPAVLIALSKDSSTALIVIGLYIAIQIVESNFITPLVQQKLIKIPPAFIIIGQVTMGVLTGALGVILATPVLAIIMVLIQAIYVERIIGKRAG